MANVSLLVVECSTCKTSTNNVILNPKHLDFTSSYLFSSFHNRKLFYANEIFQGVLIHVKAMCEAYYYGETDRIKPLCLLDRYAYQETLTLQEFSRRQFAQMNVTTIKLHELIDQVAVLAANACQVSI